MAFENFTFKHFHSEREGPLSSQFHRIFKHSITGEFFKADFRPVLCIFRTFNCSFFNPFFEPFLSIFGTHDDKF